MNDVSRVLRSFAVLVRQLVSKYDFTAAYPCQVIAQNDDGTLEIKPDVATFGPGLSRVPLRSGIPGVTAQVKGGARAYLRFENFDPARPYAEVFDPASLDSITVTAQTRVTINCPLVNLGDDDGQPVARVGDLVDSSLPPVVPVSGTINGLPFQGIATFILPIVGVVTGSAAKVNAS